MTFSAPSWFWALPTIPLLVLLLVRAEAQTALRLREFVSERLLPNLARTVDRRRRNFRFALALLGLALAMTALTQPRWGYTYYDAKRKGLDLILATDTSRSMLSNDVQPNRLQRVKLAAQDLVNELQGDRVGLIAFAGRAFLQAPLTIDYDAAVEAINDLDTNTIPEGGTNISDAIDLAVRTFGKSAIGNRAVIIFTDGEELLGDATKSAKAAADAGVKIFTVGVGTPEGSLIPITTVEGGGTAFVKDSKGQVVKSKLDQRRLKEIAESTGGFYLHLEDGPRTMKQLFADGLATMQAGDIDARLSRRPIERYQWPLGAAMFFLAASFLMRERKRMRVTAPRSIAPKKALAMAAVLLLLANASLGAAPGLDAYRQDKFSEAYQEFEKTLKEHPQTRAADKIEFDAGAAAYKMKDFGKALNSFSQALLSPDPGLQGKSHYNLGNTLYQRGETQKSDDKKLKDWTNALQHYEQTLKLAPDNTEARENLDYVKKKIEELKQKREQQPPPSPSPKPKENKKDDSKGNKKDQQQQSKQDQQKKQEQEDQKDQSGQGDQQEPDKGDEQSQAKNEPGKDKNKDESRADETPSSSPGGDEKSQQNQQGPSPSPAAQDSEGSEKRAQQDSSAGDQEKPDHSPSPSDKGNERPSPSPGEGEGSGSSPTPGPASSPGKKLAGEVKGAGDEKPNPNEQTAQVAEAEPEKEGQLSEKQAELLLRSMKDEERRVQLDERKVARHVYNDW
jgi:Ca-activated chloride channel family protein